MNKEDWLKKISKGLLKTSDSFKFLDDLSSDLINSLRKENFLFNPTNLVKDRKFAKDNNSESDENLELPSQTEAIVEKKTKERQKETNKKF